jgi:hypothetical protein
MLYTASAVDPGPRWPAEAVVLSVTRAAGSAFAPSAELLADFTAGRAGWRQFERRYTAEMRARYREDPRLWIDLVEQAAFEVGDVILMCDECGPHRPGAGEAFARCHRRLLKALLLAVATDRGLMVDPDTDALDRTLLEVRRKAVLAAEGFPLTCPVCRRPAGGGRSPATRSASVSVSAPDHVLSVISTFTPVPRARRARRGRSCEKVPPLQSRGGELVRVAARRRPGTATGPIRATSTTAPE